MCSVDDCTNKVQVRGLCTKHRAKPCTVEGCATKAQARGLCSKHGANGECVKVGCSTPAVKKGNCFHHSTKVTCSTAGCGSNAVGKGLCTKHGAHGVCSADGCDKGVRERGVCFKHSAKPVCSWERCTTPAQKRGRCGKHGGGRTKCQFAGCTTGLTSTKESHCDKHGGNKSRILRKALLQTRRRQHESVQGRSAKELQCERHSGDTLQLGVGSSSSKGRSTQNPKGPRIVELEKSLKKAKLDTDAQEAAFAKMLAAKEGSINKLKKRVATTVVESNAVIATNV